jgi:putative sterol carrier protein
MTKSEMAAKLNSSSAWLPGKRVKIDFGGSEGVVMLDGQANQVTEEDGPSDTTIRVSWADWEAMSSGQLDGMTAFMQGKLKVKAICPPRCSSKACWGSCGADPILHREVESSFRFA